MIFPCTLLLSKTAPRSIASNNYGSSHTKAPRISKASQSTAQPAQSSQSQSNSKSAHHGVWQGCCVQSSEAGVEGATEPAARSWIWWRSCPWLTLRRWRFKALVDRFSKLIFPLQGTLLYIHLTQNILKTLSCKFPNKTAGHFQVKSDWNTFKTHRCLHVVKDCRRYPSKKDNGVEKKHAHLHNSTASSVQSFGFWSMWPCISEAFTVRKMRNQPCSLPRWSAKRRKQAPGSQLDPTKFCIMLDIFQLCQPGVVVQNKLPVQTWSKGIRWI